MLWQVLNNLRFCGRWKMGILSVCVSLPQRPAVSGTRDIAWWLLSVSFSVQRLVEQKISFYILHSITTQFAQEKCTRNVLLTTDPVEGAGAVPPTMLMPTKDGVTALAQAQRLKALGGVGSSGPNVNADNCGFDHDHVIHIPRYGWMWLESTIFTRAIEAVMHTIM